MPAHMLEKMHGKIQPGSTVMIIFCITFIATKHKMWTRKIKQKLNK